MRIFRTPHASSTTSRPKSANRHSMGACTLGGLAICLAALGAVGLASCGGPTKSSTSPVSGEAGWLEPTEAQASRLRLKALEAEVVQSGDEFDQLLVWFVQQGEIAYPTLLDMVAGDDVLAAEVGLTTISALRDPRLLEPLMQRVDQSQLKGDNLRYGFARARLALGDFGGTTTLIDAMEHANPTKRKIAYGAISEFTRSNFPFDPNGTPEVRAQQIAKWREWAAARMADPMLKNGADK